MNIEHFTTAELRNELARRSGCEPEIDCQIHRYRRAEEHYESARQSAKCGEGPCMPFEYYFDWQVKSDSGASVEECDTYASDQHAIRMSRRQF